MKSAWCRCVMLAAVLAVGALETANAHGALRGLAVAHGSDSDHDQEAGDAVESTGEWKELTAAREAMATAATTTTAGDDNVGSDAKASTQSFDFASIVEDDKTNDIAHVNAARGAIGGFTPAQQKPDTALPPISESAAAARPISEISNSAIQKDPVAYGVATEKPSSAGTKGKPPAMKDSAAAAKPISAISPAAIQKDPAAYGVLTKAPAVEKPPMMSESAAAAKPIEDIPTAAIQRDPASYGVTTPAPPTKDAQGKPTPPDQSTKQSAK